MRHWKGILAMTALLCAFSLLGLFGCSRRPVSGGTTDKTDPKAPKSIESTELTSLDTHFILSYRWNRNEDHSFSFVIKPDESGTLTAYEENLGISRPVDSELTYALMKIITDRNLASSNGVYRVTAGLPPDYGECWFKAGFASGETLSFTVNNNPGARWAKDLYDTFARWFSEKGNDSLYPEKYTSNVARLILKMKDNGIYTRYMDINVNENKAIDGQTYLLLKDVYDLAGQKEITYGYAPFPADYPEKVTRMLSDFDFALKYDFMMFEGSGSGGVPRDEEDPSVPYLEIYLEYEDGRRMSVETSDSGTISYLKPLTDRLTAYLDSLFS